MLERELFPPIKEMFEKSGFTVNAEVKDCDAVVRKDDIVFIVEMKCSLSVRLLAQAIDRQKVIRDVYIAVPKPKNYRADKFRDTLNVIKKLELGLIFVTFNKNFSYAEIVCEPEVFKSARISPERRKSVIDEVNSRRYDVNVGGIGKQKIATAYTEKAVHIACLLEKYGELSTGRLRELGSDKSATASILYNNYYGWFSRMGRGVYGLSSKWRENTDYSALIGYYRRFVNQE